MNRPKAIAVAALALAALLLPVEGVAALLVGAEAATFGRVVTGVWIFKAMLLVHAAILAVLARLAPPQAGTALVERPPRAREPLAGWYRVVLGGILVLALGLRLYDLGDGLWFDEIQTLVSYARLPLGQIVATFDTTNQHMLYSVLAGLSVAIFGESAWALRLPAALLGVASLGSLYWFASLVASRREALLAVLLLAVSYHHVWFSQNARGYTGLLLWTLVGSALFVRLISDPKPRGWGQAALYGLSMALAVYTHATAVFVVIAHCLIWAVLWLRARRRGAAATAAVPFAGFVLAATFSLQLHALVLPQFLDTILVPTMEGAATSWKDPLWFVTETMRVLAAGVPGGLVTVAAAILVVTVGIVSYARESGAIAAVMLVPGLLTALVLLSVEHNLWPRFFFFSAGFAVLIAIRGALATGGALPGGLGRAIATVALIVVAAGSAFTVPTAYHPKQDYQGALEYMRRESAPGDAIVTVDMSRYIYQEYLAPDWLSVTDARELEQIESRHHRTWLLYTFPTRLAAVHPDIWTRIQSRYSTAAEFPGTVGEGTVVVKVNR